MKIENKFFWCGLLLTPAITFYLVLLFNPPELAKISINGVPLTIALGLFVIIWTIAVTFLYTFKIVSKK